MELVIFLYFFSLQVCDLTFLGNLLSSILCKFSLQFILYCLNLSLILNIPNCSLMSLLLFCPKVYIMPLVLKISFQQLQFSSCLIDTITNNTMKIVNIVKWHITLLFDDYGFPVFWKCWMIRLWIHLERVTAESITPEEG